MLQLQHHATSGDVSLNIGYDAATVEDAPEQHVESSRPLRLGSEIAIIAINSLLTDRSPRLSGLSKEHVQLLGATDNPLPPIVVHRETMRVVDGLHRLRVSQLRGDKKVAVCFFDGSEEEAFIEAVQANMAHGLPLTLADREAAAIRIMGSYPQHSDRQLAAITGLSAGKVAAIRRKKPEASEANARIGRDGRIRPVDSVAGRQAASQAISKYPGASLRDIAKIAGVSPNTVRYVRQRMQQGEDPVPRRDAGSTRRCGSSTPRNLMPSSGSRDRRSLLQLLFKDPSLRFSESGRVLLHSIDALASEPAIQDDLLEALPPHCAYLLVELAERCADEWREISTKLKQRLREMA
jgi:hypothetical protein